MMHVLVSLWQLPETAFDGRLPQLGEPLVSIVQQAPGFIAAFWTYEHANGKSFGFVLLQTAEQAHDLKNAIETCIEDAAEPRDHLGAQLEMIRVQEIVAHVRTETIPAATG